MGNDKRGPSVSATAATAAGAAAGLGGIAQLLADPPGWQAWLAVLGGAAAVYLLFSFLARRQARSPERRSRAEERWLNPRTRLDRWAVGVFERPGVFWRLLTFAAVGLLLLCSLALVITWRSEQHLRRTGLVTTAIVTSTREGCTGECQIVTLRYHASGQDQVVTEQTDTGSSFSVGDQARVRYDPARPGDAQLLTMGASEAGFFLFMVVFSAILMCLGIAMARRSERRARAPEPHRGP